MIISSEKIGVASDVPRFSLRALIVAITVISVCIWLVSSVVAYLSNLESRRQNELTRLAILDKATLVAIVDDVEAVRAKLGRTPNDKSELEALLGRPLPFVHDNGNRRPINYFKTGINSFMLQYELWATDDWIYNSDDPKAGWVQHWY
jgi:hypothetical protein